MEKMTQDELNEILADHEEWPQNENGGVIVDFSRHDLSGLDLSGRNLRHINFSNSILDGTNFNNSILNFSLFIGANASNASFYGAKTFQTDFTRTELPKKTYHLLDEEYGMFIHRDWVRVCCKHFTAQQWLSFTEEEIFKMDGRRALNFYPRLVEIINQYCN